MEQLAERFNNFFTSKISKIRDNLDSETTVTDSQNICATFDNDHKITSILETLPPASEGEIGKIMNASPPKSCDSD